MMSNLLDAVGFMRRLASRTPSSLSQLNESLDERSPGIGPWTVGAFKLKVRRRIASCIQEGVPAVVWRPIAMGAPYLGVRGEVDRNPGRLSIRSHVQLRAP